MLNYDWGNQSALMFTGDEPAQESDQNRQIFDHYNHTFNETLINPNGFNPNHHHNYNPPDPHTQTHFHTTLFDPTRQYGVSYVPPPMLSLEPIGAGSSEGGYVVVPKNEPAGGVDFMSRIGLNLGGRTYFSSSEDDFVNRLYRRSRALDPGSFNAPRCQAEGCSADLTHAKHYHRRHKVCEFHSKAATVIAGGLTQRFCQQCSRFHLLAEFDNGKRSCRKRLADHNRRRRKSHQPNKSYTETALNSSSTENNSRTQLQTSSTQPSSSVTISQPLISLETNFRETSYQANVFSSEPTNSPFFSNG